uniref:HTH CENPB-type domain-containing protein n=1 Tax=Globisporangium ultimum (strain ATCC 200006 / CBS 805.95 / DAOM BR144) TaxID=431595 RepID=K3WVV1_GLOUD
MAAALGNNHDAATASTAPKKQRNQYNLEFKLEVASQYEPNVHGRGFEALARQYGISKSNVMDWVSKKPQMLASLAAKGGHAARQAFRLDGCGRKSAYTALEDKLGKWVLEQNAQGVRVKDKDIKDRAMLIFREMHPEMRADDENAFKASSGWLARFKIRKNLVVRRPNKVGGDDDEEENIPVAGETNAKRFHGNDSDSP